MKKMNEIITNQAIKFIKDSILQNDLYNENTLCEIINKIPESFDLNDKKLIRRYLMFFYTYQYGDQMFKMIRLLISNLETTKVSIPTDYFDNIRELEYFSEICSTLGIIELRSFEHYGRIMYSFDLIIKKNKKGK